MLRNSKRPSVRPETSSSSGDFQLSGFFLLRAPTLGFEQFRLWSGELLSPAAANKGSTTLEAALKADREALCARLLDAFRDPVLREACYLAAPFLHQEVLGEDAQRINPDRKTLRKAEAALCRYLARACSRSTPFGLWAGVALGRIAKDTILNWADRGTWRRHTRLDMGVLSEFIDSLDLTLLPDETIRYRANSTAVRVGSTLRYLDVADNQPILASVEHSVAVEAVLAEVGAESGASGSAILDRLASLGATQTEARQFMADMIKARVLVPLPEFRATAQEPLLDLAADLRRCGAEDPSCALEAAHEELRVLDSKGLGRSEDEYRTLEARLASKGFPPSKPMFQVDLFMRSDQLAIGGEVLATFLEGVDVLSRLPPLTGRRTGRPIDEFRAAYVERYGTRAVPLAEVLDPESGIRVHEFVPASSAESPLLNRERNRNGSPHDEGLRWDSGHNVLLRLLTESQRAGAHEIRPTSQDLASLSPETELRLPDAFVVAGSVFAASPADLQAGKVRVYVSHLQGPSGAQLLGRFCHLDDGLRQCTENHLRSEEVLRPDAVFAEICYLPNSRVGNVILRPPLRPWELPYRSGRGRPGVQEIAVEDLVVYIDTDRVRLWSRALGIEVVPRLSSAHNSSTSESPLYRFLCALQYQGVTPFHGWNWGPLSSAPTLPRVCVGNVVLSLAQWTIAREDIGRADSVESVGRLYTRMRKIREDRGLPRYVFAGNTDRRLLLDLDNVMSLESLANISRSEPTITLSEAAPLDSAELEKSSGPLFHEVLLPCVQEKESPFRDRKARGSGAGPADRRAGRRRSFPPGSEWLSAQIYCGRKSADSILFSIISPLGRAALKEGVASKWFFIRYADPEPHLRFRLQGYEAATIILPRLEQALSSIPEWWWRLTLVPYEREVERYGGSEGVDLSEAVFHHDSEFVTSALERQHSTAPGGDDRWLLALLSTDQLLGDFGLDLGRRAEFVRAHARTLRASLDSGQALERRLGKRYREHRERIEAALDAYRETALGLGERTALDARTVAAQRLARLLEASVPSDASSVLRSHVHMHLNRIFLDRHLEHEYAIYSYLDRAYRSCLARGRTELARVPG